MRNSSYLIESLGSSRSRDNSHLSLPQTLDHSSYKILNHSLQSVRLDPIKKSEINIDKAPAYLNSRKRFDVAKSVDFSQKSLNKSLTIGEVAGTQVLIKWGIDSYLTQAATEEIQILMPYFDLAKIVLGFRNILRYDHMDKCGIGIDC